MWNPGFSIACLVIAAFALLDVTFPLAADTIYVSNFGDSTVSRITADGQPQTYASGLHFPYGLAFDPHGNLLCASGQQTNLVYSIDPNGMSRAYGSGPRYANLTGLAFDAQGSLYAADQNNNVVVRLLRGGGITNFATGLNVPWGLAFDAGGNLYIANWGNGVISKVTPPRHTRHLRQRLLRSLRPGLRRPGQPVRLRKRGRHLAGQPAGGEVGVQQRACGAPWNGLRHRGELVCRVQ